MPKNKEKEIEKIDLLEPEPEITIVSPRYSPVPKVVSFIVIHAINEDGKKFKPGDEYTGKFIERFLRDGQIRQQDK